MEHTDRMSRRGFLAGVSTAGAIVASGCTGSDGGSTPTTTAESAGSPTASATSSATPTATFSGPFERSVDPSRTYLRTNGDDAGDARPIALATLGLAPGRRITIERLGSFGGIPQSGKGMTGVFSASGDLGPSDTRERVAEAIDAGEDYETSPTYNGSVPTDVPEDFLIADHEGTQQRVTLAIPDGATHLFVAAVDNFYQDNSQGDPPFAVRIETAD